MKTTIKSLAVFQALLVATALPMLIVFSMDAPGSTFGLAQTVMVGGYVLIYIMLPLGLVKRMERFDGQSGKIFWVLAVLSFLAGRFSIVMSALAIWGRRKAKKFYDELDRGLGISRA